MNLTKDTLLSTLGFTSNNGITIGNARFVVNGNETVQDLINKINTNENTYVNASIKNGEIYIRRIDETDQDITMYGGTLEEDDILNRIGLYQQNTGTNSQKREVYYTVNATDSNGNTLSTNIFSDNNGKFFYTLEQEDGKSITLELKSAGSTILTINNSDEQISESMNNIINSINSEIEVTNNKAIKDFVKVFNSVASQAADILKLSSNTTSYSDKSAVNNFVQKLNSTITQIGGKLGFEVGLSFEYNASTNTSSLKFDTEKFFDAIDKDSEGVAKYLSDVSKEIVSSIESFMSGSLKNISSSSNSKINQYNDKISHLKNENQKYASKLESDYKMIEQLLGQTKNQYSELFSALS